ncbi:MAG TPA: hypothetical protein VL588_02080, partial [Bdellovibrionota bacterium]|nr:hypothetical protein [Bdellovibrionota bacterium]
MFSTATPTLTRTFPPESSGHEIDVTFAAGHLPSDSGALLHLFGDGVCGVYMGSAYTYGASTFAIPIEFYAPGTATISVMSEAGGVLSDCSNS